MAKLLSLPDAIEAVTGQRPNPSTCWRWAVQAPPGKRLKSWMVGSRRLTTVEAVNEWISMRTKESTPDENRIQERLNEALA